jgi:chromosome segregation ATPase
METEKEDVGLLPVKFSLADARIAELETEYAGLTIAGVEDKDGYRDVHKARMVVKGYRVEVEKTRKLLKSDALEYGRKVDAEAKRLTALLAPIEDRLSEEETRIDNEKREIAAAAEKARRDALDDRVRKANAVGMEASVSELEAMSEEDFGLALQAAKVLAEEKAKLEAQERAQREAEAREVAEARATLEAEQATLREQQATLEADRRKVEDAQAKQARESELQKAREEAAERAKAEAAAAETIRQAEAQRAAQEQREAQERQPEIDRVKAFAAHLAGLEIPSVSGDVQKGIREVLADASLSIRMLVDPFAS